MRTVRFSSADGRSRAGIWTASGIEYGDTTYDLTEVSILPPTEPSKIIAVGKNHQSSLGYGTDERPSVPRLFFKPAHTVVGHGSTVTLPPNATDVVYEAELGVVIKRQCRAVPASGADSVIAGFTCVNDISNLDAQSISAGDIRVKGFDNAAPIGPVVATPDEVPADASIELILNGESRQKAPRSELVFSIPELIEEITQYLTLEPGDIIATGTPSGIDTLSDGDHVEIAIEGVGTLEHDVVAAQ